MATVLGGTLGYVLALKVDLAARGGLQAAHDVGGGGLTATGLADDADRLTGHEPNRYTLDGVNQVGVQNRAGTVLKVTWTSSRKMIGSTPLTAVSLIYITSA